MRGDAPRELSSAENPCPHLRERGWSARGPAEHAQWRPGARAPHPGLAGRRGCHGSGVAAGARAGPEAAGSGAVCGAPEPDSGVRNAEGRPGSAAAMSLGSGDPASETVSARAGGPAARSPQPAGSAGRGAGRTKAAHGRRPPVTAAIIVTA